MATKLRYTFDSLIDTFSIQVLQQLPLLDKWLLGSVFEFDTVQQQILADAYLGMSRMGDYWNEEELKMNFISLILYITEINEPGKIQTFFERSFQAKRNQITLSVKCDLMVATPLGINSPKAPYFFLQEFKRGRGDIYDPEAQMLAAMLIAQTLNHDDKPLFGAYILGRNWFFAALEEDNYCRSRQFDASQKDDLHQIIFILRKLKQLILNHPQ